MSIDIILDKLLENIVDANFNGYNYSLYEPAKDQLYSLLMDVIEIDPANRFNCEALRIEQRTKLKELFNEKEK